MCRCVKFCSLLAVFFHSHCLADVIASLSVAIHVDIDCGSIFDTLIDIQLFLY